MLLDHGGFTCDLPFDGTWALSKHCIQGRALNAAVTSYIFVVQQIRNINNVVS